MKAIRLLGVASVSAPIGAALLLLALLVDGEGTAEAQPVWPDRLPGQPPAGCTRVHDVSVPKGTQFPHAVGFAIGRSDLKPDDRIVIEEVRGTRPSFEVGGIYLVRGKYTLGSRADARLSLTVTTRTPGDCTKGNGRGVLDVRRGSGSFELASVFAYEGYPHVWFRVGDQSAGGVYFGRGALLPPK